jgi:hypothetical protein
LSRQLERPRHETEGRLARAIRLAEDGGTFRQKSEAHYENLCTSVWWFDEIAPVNAGYTAFEAMALASEHATNLEFLVTLLQAARLRSPLRHDPLARPRGAAAHQERVCGRFFQIAKVATSWYSLALACR